MKLSFNIICIASGILCLAPLTLAQEQSDEHPYLTEKFFVDLGVFFPERSFAFTVNSTIDGPQDPIDFEAEFGAKETDEVFSLNFGWRFGEKWSLEGQYFGASGEKSAVLLEDVEWGDVVFLAGSGARGGTDFSLIRTFLARRFESGEKHEFGVGAGLHWLEIGAFLEGSIETDGGDTGFHRESVEVLAPLPNIGAWYMHSLSPKFALLARVDWFGASIDQYSGYMTNASVGLNYQVFEYAGIGINYNAFNLNLDIDKSDWRGNADLSYEGLYAYLSFYW